MNVINFFIKGFKFIFSRYAPRGARLSFSQAGEDIIVSSIFKRLGVESPFYIDIGSHDPIFGNNTYLLYLNGGRGVLVEPNQGLYQMARKKRPEDICINAGVGKIDGEADFYIFERSTRSTFSKKQADEWQSQSGQKSVIKKKKLISLDTLVKQYSSSKSLDLISIDAEGFDMEILSGYSFNKRPKVFCIEMSEGITEFMLEHRYKLEAYIFQNAIFVDKMAKSV